MTNGTRRLELARARSSVTRLASCGALLAVLVTPGTAAAVTVDDDVVDVECGRWEYSYEPVPYEGLSIGRLPTFSYGADLDDVVSALGEVVAAVEEVAEAVARAEGPQIQSATCVEWVEFRR